MNRLKKKQKSATVAYPVSLNHIVGTQYLYGYYHASSNYYNVVACAEVYKPSITQNHKELQCIGIVNALPENKDEYALQVNIVDKEAKFSTKEGLVTSLYPYNLLLDVFSRNTGIIESDIMMQKGAVLVGCGSVNSFVALELAKAGLGNFLLLDMDVLEYHNLCRHQCGMEDVGRYKVEALRDKILSFNPSAKVETFVGMVEEVPKTVFDAFFNSTNKSVVIGGGDNRESDLYADKVARIFNSPFVSIGLWKRAFAGEVFYTDADDSLARYKDLTEGIGFNESKQNQNKRFYVGEEELERVSFEPGISVDITYVASIGTKLIIDLLNRDNPNYTVRLLDSLTQYTLICNSNKTEVGGEMAEIFSYPLQVSNSIHVEKVSATVN